MTDKPRPGHGPYPAGNFVRQIPEGDGRHRLVCTDCGFIDYQNPRVVVGSVCAWGNRLLLCRRAISPRRGFWTLPAGFLEANETTMDGAMREAWEEARARIVIERLLAVYNVPHLSHVLLIYTARLLNDAIEPGPESEAVRLWGWEEIPWAELAFPSVRWALGHYRESLSSNDRSARADPQEETGGYGLASEGHHSTGHAPKGKETVPPGHSTAAVQQMASTSPSEPRQSGPRLCSADPGES